MIFDAKYLCEEKCHTVNLRPRFPEITVAKLMGWWQSLMGTLASCISEITFHTKSSLTDINVQIYTSVPTTATFLRSIFLIIWLLLETALSKFRSTLTYFHFGKLSVFELVMASRFLTLKNARKKHVDITEANIIRQYNQYMGGVDVMDKMLSSYWSKLRSKKWWWNLFSHALNMAVVAA
ncbi:hypothetical protein T10_1569 [Trichinella papuae]|uniref:PiggyBac transposable element-derived protein domain-containing protein n=1 Tax=Trichinella papuae TaxID=268474 RepID=A0A0V1M9Z8_9BILA|nr:hypothetical protein T10_1569 [Trichinella papuae]